MGSFPQFRDDGLIVVTPIVVLDRRMVKKKNIIAVQLCFQWAKCSSEDPTWEPHKKGILSLLLILEDKDVLKEKRNGNNGVLRQSTTIKI
ncbi:hypothetical protein Tco_1126466 [Tanacetum coccineum]